MFVNIMRSNFFISILLAVLFVFCWVALGKAQDTPSVKKEPVPAKSEEQCLDKMYLLNNWAEVKSQAVCQTSSWKDLPFYRFLFKLELRMLEKEIPLEVVYLLLVVPILATFVAFMRQVIGLKSFGVQMPVMLALTFFILGFKVGLFLFIIILATGTLVRMLARKLRLLYIPRMAIFLAVTSLMVFIYIGVGIEVFQRYLLAMSVFPVLILIALSEQLIAAQMELGYKAAIRLTVESVIIGMLGLVLLSFDGFHSLLLIYPEIILLALIINILLGRFVGLRLTEIYRFRQLFNEEIGK